VIIRDFNVADVALRPSEANAPLLVDSYAELAFSIPFKRFEPVRGRNAQVIEIVSLTEHGKLVKRALLNVPGQAFRPPPIPDFFGFRVRAAPDHAWNIGVLTRGVNRLVCINFVSVPIPRRV